MQDCNQNICVLFFSRSPEAEAKYKKLSGDYNTRKNTQIAYSLIQHSRRQIKKTRLPYCEINEEEQVGSSFGERITHAFCSIFEKGFDYIVAVGNDVPRLKAKHIIHSAKQLISGKAEVVLGPDRDGGTWLIGFSRSAFEAPAFQRLPWCTGNLLNELTKQHKATIQLLETLSDLDHPAALNKFSRSISSELSLLQLIQRISSVLSSSPGNPQFENSFRLSPAVFGNMLLRAPPVC